MEDDSGTVAGGGGASEEEKKPPEGETKVKRKMKTASQLEILEKTYAVETYPSESLRAELSAKLGLSDRQLQMWFCHRRLKDRKTPPVKRQRKDASPATIVASSSVIGDDMVAGEMGNEHGSGSGSGSSLFAHVDSQQRIVPRAGVAHARIGADMPAMKRYYEPPQAISELRAIAFVEAQLGEPLREDGPILGMEFDPLPPGAFGAPIAPVAQQKSVGRLYDTNTYERPVTKIVKGAPRTVHEYQFLPEQPSIRNETYERAVPSHYFSSPTDVSSSRASLANGRSFLHGNEQLPSGYGFQCAVPSLSVLPQQDRQHALPSASGEYDIISRKNMFANDGVDAHYGAQPASGLDNPYVSTDGHVTHDEDISRTERKRKSEEARIAKEVEAHEKRIRKELEKQDILRRKREEQMRKEMERQDRERRKEEERLLREKQREEERYQREQRREMERREKFLQKESMRAEKMRIKEELRREKEAARLKAACDRATARRIAKESIELIEDERLELLELAALSRGLPSILSLDSETLQNLECFRDKLAEFPLKSAHLKRPFAIQPWTDSEDSIGNLLMVWRFLITFADVLGLWPFTLDEFVQAFHDYDSRLLGEIHVALLRSIIKDIEDVARTPATGLGANQNSAANPGGGHPQIVEGAYAWGFDIRSWQRHLNPLTWPEILRQFALSAGLGPKLKKRNIEQAYHRDENEGNDGENIILNLRNGAAAENAFAIMQERGFANPRRSRHCLTPGTVKFAAFHVLSLEGSKGLTILEVADKIQKSGLRDLTTSKTPEASIAAALSRDTKLFERTAPSTYCVRTPYRKDPADAEAILSAAREKIQIFKNGYFDGEEADDVEADDVEAADVERDEDSESDAAEDPDADELGNESKANEEAFLSFESSRFQVNTHPGNGQVTSDDVVMENRQSVPKNQSIRLLSLESEEFKDVRGTDNPVGQSVDFTETNVGTVHPEQEDTVIDESNPGEPWVCGLTEGEYSDLSVLERLSALVALIGVANEGNSIRVVLEERLEAANALKKQMWAEAQLDKRRMKEEYVMKIQYSSLSGSKVEHNHSIFTAEGRQSPFPLLDDKNDLMAVDPVFQQEHAHDARVDPNDSTNISSERNQQTTDFVSSTDNICLQQPGYAVEKSRSQLKAYIGHKAEEMYVYRSLPHGQDRRRNRYWQFITSASRNDPGSGRLFLELRDGSWRLIDSGKDFDSLLACLDVRGVRESHLHSMLQKIEVSFKESVGRNSRCTNTRVLAGSTVKREVSKMADLDLDVNTGSPNGAIELSNSDRPECSSTFVIQLGRNETEKKDALKRYQDFEKWMWEECTNSSILCATKNGEKKRKQLAGICNHCRELYLFEDNHCPSCHRTFASTVKELKFSEHVAKCKDNSKGALGRMLHELNSAPALRIRLLKALLAVMEVSVPAEALQPAWSGDYRKIWGMKLLSASSADDLLKILTLAEGAIKRDSLSSSFETTSELLGSGSTIESTATNFFQPEMASVLPWIPQTTSAVALRLMELDASISYVPGQQVDAQKGKVSGNVMGFPSKLAVVKNISEDNPAQAPHEAENLQLEAWIDPLAVPTLLGRAQGGRGRGRGRTRGGRSQRKAINSKSEAALKSTTNSDRFGQLQGWKGRARGRGGRKRGRRSARSRQKSVKKVVDAACGRNKQPAHVIQENSRRSSPLEWDTEETPGIQAKGAENASSSESSDYNDYNGQATGDEYDDLVVNEYPNINGMSESLGGRLGFNADAEEDEDDPIEGGDFDNDVDDSDEDGHEDTDVERYINDDSDNDGNRDEYRDQIDNLDQIEDSTSSGYSD